VQTVLCAELGGKNKNKQNQTAVKKKESIKQKTTTNKQTNRGKFEGTI